MKVTSGVHRRQAQRVFACLVVAVAGLVLSGCTAFDDPTTFLPPEGALPPDGSATQLRQQVIAAIDAGDKKALVDLFTSAPSAYSAESAGVVFDECSKISPVGREMSSDSDVSPKLMGVQLVGKAKQDSASGQSCSFVLVWTGAGPWELEIGRPQPSA